MWKRWVSDQLELPVASDAPLRPTSLRRAAMVMAYRSSFVGQGLVFKAQPGMSEHGYT